MLKLSSKRSLSSSFSLIRKHDQFLNQKCSSVTEIDEEFIECLDKMKVTLRNVDGFWHQKGISVSAPQVGYLLRMFIVRKGMNFRTF